MEKNTIVSGDYAGKFMVVKKAYNEPNVIMLSNGKESVMINREDVVNWAVLDGSEKVSATSAFTRGAVGAVAFGGLGLLAGALSAKKKGAYTVGIEYNHEGSRKKTVIYIDEKTYRHIASKLF